MTKTAAARQNFSVFAYEDWPLRFTITDEAGDPKDLTGCSSVWVLKESAEGTELLRKSGTPEDQGIYPGVLLLTVTKTETAALHGALYYELQITDVLGKTRKAACGRVVVQPTGIRQ